MITAPVVVNTQGCPNTSAAAVLLPLARDEQHCADWREPACSTPLLFAPTAFKSVRPTWLLHEQRYRHRVAQQQPRTNQTLLWLLVLVELLLLLFRGSTAIGTATKSVHTASPSLHDADVGFLYDGRCYRARSTINRFIYNCCLASSSSSSNGSRASTTAAADDGNCNHDSSHRPQNPVAATTSPHTTTTKHPQPCTAPTDTMPPVQSKHRHSLTSLLLELLQRKDLY